MKEIRTVLRISKQDTWYSMKKKFIGRECTIISMYKLLGGYYSGEVCFTDNGEKRIFYAVMFKKIKPGS